MYLNMGKLRLMLLVQHSRISFQTKT